MGHRGHPTVQRVHFSHQVKRFYLSKNACIQLNLLPANFPHCKAVITPTKECPVSKQRPPAKECPTNITSNHRSTPTKPCKIPFLPVESNVEKLEMYLKDAFASSTFNLSPPFPAMNDTIPAKIHIKPGAKPDPKHVPIPVPIYWRDTIKKQLNDDVAKGVIEPVPVGEPIQWCSQMVIVQKKMAV